MVGSKLGLDPAEHPVLLTEPPFNPEVARETMVKLMFDTLSAPALYVANEAVLALLASDRRTGLVLDIGDDNAYVAPVHNVRFHLDYE